MKTCVFTPPVVFEDSGRHPQWPQVADAVIEASQQTRAMIPVLSCVCCRIVSIFLSEVDAASQVCRSRSDLQKACQGHSLTCGASLTASWCTCPVAACCVTGEVVRVRVLTECQTMRYCVMQTLEETCSAAAEATMHAMMEDLATIAPREQRTFELHDERLDLLLQQFLQELLFYNVTLHNIAVIARTLGLTISELTKGVCIDLNKDYEYQQARDQGDFWKKSGSVAAEAAPTAKALYRFNTVPTYNQVSLRSGMTPVHACVSTIGAEPRTPEEVAADFGVPLAAVHEAVHYGLHNAELLRQEREAVLVDMRARGLDKPPYVPINGTPRARDSTMRSRKRPYGPCATARYSGLRPSKRSMPCGSAVPNGLGRRDGGWVCTGVRARKSAGVRASAPPRARTSHPAPALVSTGGSPGR